MSFSVQRDEIGDVDWLAVARVVYRPVNCDLVEGLPDAQGKDPR
jgi:hypothetical protein